MREHWGCDAPAPHAVFTTTCGVCGGDGCPEPEGEWDDPNRSPCIEGEVQHYRCPSAVLAEGGAWLTEFFRAYLVLDRHGILPVQGAMYDQAAVFMEACTAVDAERAKWDGVEQQYLAEQRAPRTTIKGPEMLRRFARGDAG